MREYGDHSDREITDQTLPSLVEWAETPGIVENVQRTAQRLVELFADDGKNANDIGRIPDGTKLGLGIRLYAPDIRDDGRGLPDDIRLTRYMRVGRPSPGVVVETELYRLGNVLRGRDLSGLDLRYLDFSGVDLCDVDMSGADLRGSLIDSGTPLGHTVFRNADMRRMRFLGTLKAGRPVYLENADLREADFSHAKVSWLPIQRGRHVGRDTTKRRLRMHEHGAREPCRSRFDRNQHGRRRPAEGESDRRDDGQGIPEQDGDVRLDSKRSERAESPFP